MDFNEYQKKAEETILPTVNGNADYFFLGLADEVGEACGKRKKYIRDETPYVDFVVGLTKELGDVLWYVAGIATTYGISLQHIADSNIGKLADRKERGKLGGSGDER